MTFQLSTARQFANIRAPDGLSLIYDRSQVHQRPCLPQNIAKEITLFTAIWFTTCHKAARLADVLTVNPPVWRNNRTQVASGQRPERRAPVAGVDQFFFLFQRATYRASKAISRCGMSARSAVSSASDRVSAPESTPWRWWAVRK